MGSPVDVAIGTFRAMLKRGRSLTVWHFEALELRAEFRSDAPGEWCLELTWDACALATHRPSEIIEVCRTIARQFGCEDFDADHERVRRGDESADFIGIDLAKIEAETLVVERGGRSRIVGFVDLDGVRKKYVRGQRVTGWTVCPGAVLMARIYDKCEELGLPGREHKRDLEHEIWRAKGWDGDAQVTRVEFQMRTEALRSFNVDTLPQYFAARDKLWAYASQVWLTWRMRGPSDRRTRWVVAPEWLVVAQANLSGAVVPPASRLKRACAGAPPGQVRGAVISALGSIDTLRAIYMPPPSRGDAHLRAWLFRMYGRLFRDAGHLVANHEIRQHGLSLAEERLTARIQAVIARFDHAVQERSADTSAA